MPNIDWNDGSLKKVAEQLTNLYLTTNKSVPKIIKSVKRSNFFGKEFYDDALENFTDIIDRYTTENFGYKFRRNNNANGDGEFEPFYVLSNNFKKRGKFSTVEMYKKPVNGNSIIPNTSYGFLFSVNEEDLKIVTFDTIKNAIANINNENPETVRDGLINEYNTEQRVLDRFKDLVDCWGLRNTLDILTPAFIGYEIPSDNNEVADGLRKNLQAMKTGAGDDLYYRFKPDIVASGRIEDLTQNFDEILKNNDYDYKKVLSKLSNGDGARSTTSLKSLFAVISYSSIDGTNYLPNAKINGNKSTVISTNENTASNSLKDSNNIDIINTNHLAFQAVDDDEIPENSKIIDATTEVSNGYTVKKKKKKKSFYKDWFSKLSKTFKKDYSNTDGFEIAEDDNENIITTENNEDTESEVNENDTHIYDFQTEFEQIVEKKRRHQPLYKSIISKCSSLLEKKKKKKDTSVDNYKDIYKLSSGRRGLKYIVSIASLSFAAICFLLNTYIKDINKTVSGEELDENTYIEKIDENLAKNMTGSLSTGLFNTLDEEETIIGRNNKQDAGNSEKNDFLPGMYDIEPDPENWVSIPMPENSRMEDYTEDDSGVCYDVAVSVEVQEDGNGKFVQFTQNDMPGNEVDFFEIRIGDDSTAQAKPGETVRIDLTDDQATDLQNGQRIPIKVLGIVQDGNGVGKIVGSYGNHDDAFLETNESLTFEDGQINSDNSGNTFVNSQDTNDNNISFENDENTVNACTPDFSISQNIDGNKNYNNDNKLGEAIAEMYVTTNLPMIEIIDELSDYFPEAKDSGILGSYRRMDRFLDDNGIGPVRRFSFDNSKQIEIIAKGERLVRYVPENAEIIDNSINFNQNRDSHVFDINDSAVNKLGLQVKNRKFLEFIDDDLLQENGDFLLVA